MRNESGRNLLSPVRGTGIARVTPGEWTELPAPEELVRLEFGDHEQQGLRTRIQSIPSPWARLLLFKDALEDDEHPARRLVTSELLDALEFLWGSGTRHGAMPEYLTVRLDELAAHAERSGSVRVEEFAKALVELAPPSAGTPSRSALDRVTLMLVGGRPILATSPFTGLFTAEDAAGEATGSYFRFLETGTSRSLAERPRAFQEYVARVILPQLAGGEPTLEGNSEGRAMRGALGTWLTRAVAAAPIARAASQDESGAATQSTLAGLEPLEPSFGGLRLYRRRQGADVAESRWRLRAPRAAGAPPLVLDAEQFDGEFYPGAARVRLTRLAERDRAVLPELGERYPWVNPATDWMSDEILLLAEPLEREHVLGFASYEWRGNPSDPKYGVPRLTLPLRAAFFEYFAPADVDRMLSLTVQESGDVEATLRVPVGDGQEIKITRRYTPGGQYAPAVSLWPAFRHEGWQDYVAFRVDPSSKAGEYTSLVALGPDGRQLPSESATRTPLVRTQTFRGVPEVLEFRSALLSSHKSLGVMLPNFRPVAPRGGTHWNVGVDFGTSNTVISVRPSGEAMGRILDPGRLTLPLTQPAERTGAMTDAYFFPQTVRAAPFGTVIVALTERPDRPMALEPIGVRLNVPFGGHVYKDEWNRVAGDLKWSADREAHFLSSAFLRHVIAVVVAAAVEKGVAPENITFSWAYPRAFTPTQRSQLAGQWKEVVQALGGIGIRPDAVAEPLDESASVLRYFFNVGTMGVAGNARAILDVGGGTTDLAAYGGGRALLLDSVMLGGRNLTGPLLRAGAGQERMNPFVQAFVTWAGENHLPQEARDVAAAYLASGQIHLAFSYLVGTRWFAAGQAARFTAHRAFHRFQLLVLYFYGSLFHYLGLAFRSLDVEGGVPQTVVLAGNGSRYMTWLTQLQGGGDAAFLAALGRVLVTAAGVPDAIPPRIELSPAPKEEVASGLVAEVAIRGLDESGVRRTSVVGESVTFERSGSTQQLAAGDRFATDAVIRAAEIPSLRWSGGPLEIERFHDALVGAAESLVEQGGAWREAASEFRGLFARLPRRELEDQARGRMEYLAQKEGEFRGSLFILEATAVLERMLLDLKEEL